MRVLAWACGIAGAGLLAGTAGAQDWIEIRCDRVDPPGGMQFSPARSE
jgi:hypothetical protein